MRRLGLYGRLGRHTLDTTSSGAIRDPGQRSPWRQRERPSVGIFPTASGILSACGCISVDYVQGAGGL
jgi:hypothetical protein